MTKHEILSAGGRKYDDVTQVSKPAVSPTSQSADRPLLGRLRIWKSARQQVWKPALQNTSPNLRPGALSAAGLREINARRARDCAPYQETTGKARGYRGCR